MEEKSLFEKLQEAANLVEQMNLSFSLRDNEQFNKAYQVVKANLADVVKFITQDMMDVPGTPVDEPTELVDEPVSSMPDVPFGSPDPNIYPVDPEETIELARDEETILDPDPDEEAEDLKIAMTAPPAPE